MHPGTRSFFGTVALLILTMVITFLIIDNSISSDNQTPNKYNFPTLNPNKLMSQLSDTQPCGLSESVIEQVRSGSYPTVSIIYDFSRATQQSLQQQLGQLVKSLNPVLVKDYILIDNACQDAQAIRWVTGFVQRNRKMKLVRIQPSSGEPVSKGRARSEAIGFTKGLFYLFVSHGVTMESESFLETMLTAVTENPSAVYSPTKRVHSDTVQHLTWNLSIHEYTIKFDNRTRHLPLLNPDIFIIRSDLYQAVGGYDSYFYRDIPADNIALSLSLWLCGAEIVETTCSKYNHYLEERPRAVRYLPYAKYIQKIFGGHEANKLTVPGIEIYQLSPFEQQSIRDRQKIYKERQCLDFSWYSRKFSQSLPLIIKNTRFHNPNYKPELPPPAETGSARFGGRIFILFAGQCLKKSDDGLLGMEWCPAILTDLHRFIFNEETSQFVNLRLMKKHEDKTADKCLGFDDNAYIGLQDCDSNSKKQKFIYEKSKRQIISQFNNRCWTHVSSADNRQLIQLTECSVSESDASYQKFVLGDYY